MEYVCIKCRKTWTIGEKSDHPSGALCDNCTTEYIRNKQLSKGFHDCYRRNVEICSKEECKFWEFCNRRFLQGE